MFQRCLALSLREDAHVCSSHLSSVRLFFRIFLPFVLFNRSFPFVGTFVVCFHASQLSVFGRLTLLVLLHL